MPKNYGSRKAQRRQRDCPSFLSNCFSNIKLPSLPKINLRRREKPTKPTKPTTPTTPTPEMPKIGKADIPKLDFGVKKKTVDKYVYTPEFDVERGVTKSPSETKITPKPKIRVTSTPSKRQPIAALSKPKPTQAKPVEKKPTQKITSTVAREKKTTPELAGTTRSLRNFKFIKSLLK